MNQNQNEIIQQILRPVGKEVSFKYPEAEKRKVGILKDRVVMSAGVNASGVPYWDVIDLIEFPGETMSDTSEWIRIGYYRKLRSRLVWGSQTTITEPISTWKELFVQAARQKQWFRELLEDVVRDLDK